MSDKHDMNVVVEDEHVSFPTNKNDNADNILGKGSGWEASLDEARQANQREHSLTVPQALKAYPMAVFWSLIVSMAIVMEGYATILIGSLYAYPTYAKAFGSFEKSTNSYQIPANWQSAMGSGPQAGAIVGAFVNGWIVHRFGYKPAFSLALLLTASFVFISFFGFSVQIQAVGQIMCG